MGMNAVYRGPQDCPAVLPVFPLPGALLLPRGQMPLNIFEPRYLAMVDDVLRGERVEVAGWAIAEDDGISVALDTQLDDELALEGRVLDLIHRLNGMRKDAGLELTDRIVVTLPAGDADLVDRHAEWIKGEVLAVSLEAAGSSAEPEITKA